MSKKMNLKVFAAAVVFLLAVLFCGVQGIKPATASSSYPTFGCISSAGSPGNVSGYAGNPFILFANPSGYVDPYPSSYVWRSGEIPTLNGPGKTTTADGQQILNGSYAPSAIAVPPKSNPGYTVYIDVTPANGQTVTGVCYFQVYLNHVHTGAINNLTGTTGISWDSVANATQYKLYKDGGATPIYVGSNLTYTDTITDYVSHTYTVKTTLAGSDVSYHDVATLLPRVPPPAAPQVTYQSPLCSGEIKLSWSRVSVSGPAASYFVYDYQHNVLAQYNPNGGSSLSIVYDGVGGFTYAASGFAPGQVIQYYVSASGAGGESALTSIQAVAGSVNCAPPPPPPPPPPPASTPPAVSCSASPNPAVIDQPVTWSASVTGGTPPYTYIWDGSVTGSNSSVSTTYTRVGTYGVAVTVGDAAGYSIPRTCSVDVNLPEPVPVDTTPDDNSGNTSCGQISFSWAPVSGANQYKIYDYAKNLIATQSGTSYSAGPFGDTSDRGYYLKAYNSVSGAESDFSNEILVTPVECHSCPEHSAWNGSSCACDTGYSLSGASCLASGSVKVVLVGQDNTISSAPAGAMSGINSEPNSPDNPNLLDVFAGSSNTTFASYLSGYDVSAGYCSYASGESECSIFSSGTFGFNQSVSCDASKCGIGAVNVSAGSVLKVAYKYTAVSKPVVRASTGSSCGGTIDASWDAVNGAGQYELYNGGSQPVYIGSGLSYTDEGLVYGEVRGYTVVAYKLVGGVPVTLVVSDESDASASDKCSIAAWIDKIESCKVAVNWTKFPSPFGGGVNYEIWRSSGGSQPTQVCSRSSLENPICSEDSTTGLVDGSYNYSMKATKGGGEIYSGSIGDVSVENCAPLEVSCTTLPDGTTLETGQSKTYYQFSSRPQNDPCSSHRQKVTCNADGSLSYDVGSGWLGYTKTSCRTGSEI